MVRIALRRHVSATRERLFFPFQYEDDMKNCRDIALFGDLSFQITSRVGMEGLPVQM